MRFKDIAGVSFKIALEHIVPKTNPLYPRHANPSQNIQSIMVISSKYTFFAFTHQIRIYMCTDCFILSFFLNNNVLNYLDLPLT